MPLIDPVTMSTLKPASATAPVKPSLPIELLPGDLARIASQAHPALLLSAFYLRFPALVSDPVSTLLSSLFPLAVCQVAYVVTCLPAFGSAAAATAPAKGPKKVKFSSGKKGVDTAKGSITFATIYAMIISLLAILPFTVLQILFGAPVTSHLQHTLLCSAHISLLSLFPLIYVHGANGKRWQEVASFYCPIDEVFGGFVGCLVGAWLGAVPIPLDWDREWQKWPVTIVCGVYGGYAAGKMLGGWLWKGKKIELG